MNREIKFRCWDDSPIKDGLEGVIIPHDYMIQSDYLKDSLSGKYKLMQYTGIKDFQGKEIYDVDCGYSCCWHCEPNPPKCTSNEA